jgi:4-amino-4-deoxy-L-arabinose transferase-like glycosyltransferase
MVMTLGMFVLIIGIPFCAWALWADERGRRINQD